MLTFERADPADAPALVVLRTATAQHLTDTAGIGWWSRTPGERGVLYGMRQGYVFVAREQRAIIASFTLATKKPWAIDPRFFAPSRRPLYLTDMAVHPDRQRQGLGRQSLDAAARIARTWPADAIRLDAYDHDAGAGPFYERCGYREVGRARYRDVPLIYFELLLADETS